MRIAVDAGSEIDLEVYEGYTVPSVSVRGRVSGDLSDLNGETLYLVAELPHAFLFDGEPLFILESDDEGRLQLNGGTAPAGAKDYVGNLRIRACLDPSCETEVDVDNALVPYRVQVKAGLNVSSQVTIELPFGTPATPVTVPIGLPHDLASWSVKPGSGGSDFSVVRASKASDLPPAVVLEPISLARPGTTYIERVLVEAVLRSGETINDVIEVTFTTLPSDVTWAFERPQAHFTVRQEDALTEHSLSGAAFFPFGRSERLEYVGTTYAWPAAADAYANRDGWLFQIREPIRTTERYETELIARGCASGTCLPRGVYEALIRYRYTPESGVPVEVDYPVRMAIVP